jgi:1-acyl-sn-glycerol-3-phosphate acyltransferase
MRIDAIIVNYSIKILLRFLCRINHQELENIPASGPLILVSNHINFIEVPLLYTHLQPRPVTGFAKAEGWNNPFLRYLAEIWGAIPIHRGEPDISAIRSALESLNENKIVGLAPEGTRSGDGKLGRGHQGVVTLARQSGAPMLPLGFFGNENYKENLKSFKKVNFNIIVGNQFELIQSTRKVNTQTRQQITDEIMYQLAALLPPQYRGYYSDLSKATEEYLQFPEGSESNVKHAQR